MAAQLKARSTSSTRRLKGVVLLRTTTLPRKHAIEIETSSEDKLDMTALQALVEAQAERLSSISATRRMS